MRPIDELYKQAEKIQGQIDTFRQNCKHERQFDGWYSWRLGTILWKRMCSECDQPVGDAITNQPDTFGGNNPTWTILQS